MNCQTFTEWLETVAAEGPNLELPRELHQHQVDCQSCRAELERWQATWNLLPAALAHEPPSTDLENRIFERLQRSSPPARTASSRLSSMFHDKSKRMAYLSYAVAAGILFLLATTTLWGPNWLFPQTGKDAQELARLQDFADHVEKLDQLESAFADPQIRYVSLTSLGTQEQTQGYLLYDDVAHQGHFYGFDLPTQANRIVKLWLLDRSQSVLSSAIVEIDSKGLGAAIIPLPKDLSVLDEIVVSFENDPGAQTPSLRVRMRSKVALTRP